MGKVYAEVNLTNATDIENAERYIIGEEEIRRFNTTMLVDSGSELLCINETIQSVLGLRLREKRRFFLADDGVSQELNIVGPVEVRFQNRSTVCEAIVLPGNTECLLGSIPMEAMDVLIHPSRHELIAHPDHIKAMLRL